jgi:DNA-binding transcriptional LysR family regulator
MNIHHLELFYYVAKHGGISAAVRNIPYGIQQPAVSGQILQLEDSLGAPLFQRRPFMLTQAGEELYKFIQPFFEQLEPMAEKIRGGATQFIRVAASSVVLHDHLPDLLQKVRQRFPRLKVTLHEGIHQQIEGWLQRQEVDLAVTIIDGKGAAGIKSQKLLELPMTLVVKKNSKITSAEELWKRDRIFEPLISLPANEMMFKNFQAGLAKYQVDWPVSMEVNSVDLIETYVANGFGIGLSVALPRPNPRKDLRYIPLPEFPNIVIGALWHGKVTPLLQDLVGELQKRADEFSRMM